MTQEEKQLLLKDLCARLPYGVKVNAFGKTEDLLGIINDIASVGYDINDYDDIAAEDIKPYLRPMSSMTEEEKNEYFGRTMTIDIVKTSQQVIDWLISHHFDYRGLIEKGLALEAPEGMYF